MRSFRIPARGVVAAASATLIVGMITAGTANADNPTAAELQAKLIDSRRQVNALYMQAAAASERINGATVELEQAEKDLEVHRKTLAKAEVAHEEQSHVVEAMTVEQQLNGSGIEIAQSVLEGNEPAQILEEASSLNAVNEAMVAELDQLDASQAVLNSATDTVEAVVDKQEKALADRKAAQADIASAIADAESMETALESERDDLLAQLAQVQDRSVEEVTADQDAIDERIDASGPGADVEIPGGDTTPGPDPKPTPKPTTPKPKPPTPDPPPASGSKVETAIAFAKDQLGEPYKWGGAGPSSWDCSGLTMRAYQAAGVSMPHYAGSQYSSTKKVSVGSIKRGDLVYWSNGSASSIYHVAMYLGDGKMIHAPRPGRGVEIVSINYWIKPDLASRPG